MKAIQTHYLGATYRRGSRIVATAEGGEKPWRVVVPYDHAARDPHEVAAVALARKMGWSGKLMGGGLPNGDRAFVFVSESELVEV